jgi:hypothetical protein
VKLSKVWTSGKLERLSFTLVHLPP